MCAKSPSLLQRGISLIELIMFIVIISVALAGILLVMNKVMTHSADPLIRKQALAIGESMLEEIKLQDLSGVACVGTLAADAVRTGASSVCDYNGYKTTAGIREFTVANAVIPALASYNITGVVVTRIARWPLPLWVERPIRRQRRDDYRDCRRSYNGDCRRDGL